MEEGGMEGVCYIFVIDLNHGYVNYELAKYIVEKNGKGQSWWIKMVNCAKGHFLGIHGEGLEGVC